MKKSVFIFIFILIIPFILFTQQKSSSVDDIRARVKLGRIDEAISMANDFLKRNKNNPDAYALMGELYMQKEGMDNLKQADFYLDKALTMNPRSVLGLVNYGKLKIHRNDYALAERFFKRALRIDPGAVGAYEGMMMLYEKERNPGVLNQLKMYMERGKISPDSNVDLQLMLAEIMIKQGEFQKAVTSLRALHEKYPDNPRVNLVLADLYFELKAFDSLSFYYLKGIENLKDKDELEKRYMDFYEIMSDQEIEEYKNLPLEKKGPYLAQFWKQNDINGATEVNERLIEHFHRVKYAKTFYRSPIPPFYDDRGRTYIKWGPPDKKFQQPMGTHVGSDLTRPTESWSYESIDRNLVFDFVEIGGIYKEVRDLSDAIVGGSNIMRADDPNLLKLAILYQERSTLSDYHYRVSSNASTDLEAFLNDFQQLTGSKEAAKHDAPPSVSNFEFTFEQMDIILSCAQFRGEEGKTRYELYYSVPADERFFSNDAGAEMAGILENKYVVRDSLANIVENVQEASEIKLPKGADLTNVRVNYQRNFVKEPGSYSFWIQVENKKANMGGISSLEPKPKDFKSNDLMVSDIQFSEKIEPSKETGVGVKNGLKIAPYPFGEVFKDRPINIYYEIYNLRLDPSNETSFQIEQTIRPMKEEEGLLEKGVKRLGDLFGEDDQDAVTTIYKRTGTAINDFEYITLDVSKVSNGKKTLAIRITDFVSGATAVVTKNFIVR